MCSMSFIATSRLKRYLVFITQMMKNAAPRMMKRHNKISTCSVKDTQQDRGQKEKALYVNY